MRTRLFILGLLFAAASLHATKPRAHSVAPVVPATPVESECKSTLIKLLDAYHEKGSSSKVFMEVTEYSRIGTEESEPMTFSVWMDGAKMRYQNPFADIFQDSHIQVRIDQTNREIQIRNVRDVAGDESLAQHFSMGAVAHVDSLLKYASNVTCNKDGLTGRVELAFPATINGLEQPYKAFAFEYNTRFMRIVKQEYEYYTTSGQSVRDIYQYNKLTTEFDASALFENALSQVLNGDELKPAYRDYELVDLR